MFANQIGKGESSKTPIAFTNSIAAGAACRARNASSVGVRGVHRGTAGNA